MDKCVVIVRLAKPPSRIRLFIHRAEKVLENIRLISVSHFMMGHLILICSTAFLSLPQNPYSQLCTPIHDSYRCVLSETKTSNTKLLVYTSCLLSNPLTIWRSRLSCMGNRDRSWHPDKLFYSIASPKELLHQANIQAEVHLKTKRFILVNNWSSPKRPLSCQVGHLIMTYLDRAKLYHLVKALERDNYRYGFVYDH